VQRLLATNYRTNGNGAKAIRHNYILNSGILWCGKCCEEMEGRSGTGSKGARYYYSKCKNPECSFKVPANEIEGLVLNRLKELALRQDILEELVIDTNKRLHEELPHILSQKILLERELAEVNNTADSLMSRWASVAGSEWGVFFTEKLNSLAKRRWEIEEALLPLKTPVGEIENEAVSKDMVKTALERMDGIFANLQPTSRMV